MRPHYRLLLALLHVIGIAARIQAQSEPEIDFVYRVLPSDFNSDRKTQMMRNYQRRQVHAAMDTRLQELEEALDSPEAVAAYQRKRRNYLDSVFGPLPERMPLNPLVTKVINRDGYTIENVLFESLPGFHVTGNLYRPVGTGPFPGVLLPCGHSANGKAYASYQKASILLTQHGFVVFCFDPIGQGERRQLIGELPHPIDKPISEHNKLGVAPILLGRSLAAMMVWDGIRSIDYLCSRNDVDSNRIGCTGISGGGNLTSYLMAFDERIVAAAPGCFMTTHRRKNESPGPGDAEQNLFGQIRDGFDHADFILTRAPKPTLILSATQDYVPIEGTWEAFRQAKRVYTCLGYPERIDLVEANEQHGFTRPLREASVNFMARWLQDRSLQVREDEEVSVLADADLQVTPDGQVGWLTGAKSIFDLFEEQAELLVERRPTLTADIVRDVAGIRSLSQLPMPQVDEADEAGMTAGVGDEGGPAPMPEPQRLIFHPEQGISLPALYWPGGNEEPILLAPGDGMNKLVEEARRLQRGGHPVLIVEVRDTGETKTRNWRFYGADAYIAYMLGRNWLAMRSEDLLLCSRWLAETCGRNSVALRARGEVVPAALHAYFLEPQLISDITTIDGLSSWRQLMNDREADMHIHQVVHGSLQYYDLPDLRNR